MNLSGVLIDRLTNLAVGCGSVAFSLATAQEALSPVGATVSAVAVPAVIAGLNVIGFSKLSACKHSADCRKTLNRVAEKLRSEWIIQMEDGWANVADETLERLGSTLGACTLTPDQLAKIAITAGDKDFVEAATEAVVASLGAADPYFDEKTVAARFAKAVIRRTFELAVADENYFKRLNPHLQLEALAALGRIEQSIADIPYIAAHMRRSVGSSHNQSRFGASVDDLLSEERIPEDDLNARNILLHGPPNVGKTCLALRMAFRRVGADSTLYFDAKLDRSADLTVLDEYLPTSAPYVIVVDDLHTARTTLPTWVDPVSAFSRRRPGLVTVIWVTRDADVQNLLEVNGAEAQAHPFPIRSLTDLFFNDLRGLGRGGRLIAALEAGLDPAIVRDLARMRWQEQILYADVVKAVRAAVKVYASEPIGAAGELGDKANDAYKALMPFSAIGYPVERSFIAKVSGIDTAGLGDLAKKGLCLLGNQSRPDGRDHPTAQLREHPFQLRRTLAHLDEAETEHASIERLWGRKITPPQLDSLTKAAIGRYVCDPGSESEQLARLTMLHERSEWAGVPEPIAAAALFLEESQPGTALGKRARMVRMKAGRKCYPLQERAFSDQLLKDFQWWDEHKEAALRHPDEMSSGLGLNLILYEQGYIYSLLEDYDKASVTLRESVDAGFRAIARGTADRATESQLAAAKDALANIWISGIHEVGCALRGALRRFAHNEATEAGWDEYGARIEAIFVAIKQAMDLGSSARQSGTPFLVAARNSLRPNSDVDVTRGIDLSQPSHTSALQRHTINAWMHAVEMPRWPWLFGATNEGSRHGDISVPSISDFARLAPVTGEGRLAYRVQHLDLLAKSERGEKADLTAALEIAAMMRAGSMFEGIGDHLLLTWRIAAASREDQDAVGWFLRQHVPDVGFNGLAKAAMTRMQPG